MARALGLAVAWPLGQYLGGLSAARGYEAGALAGRLMRVLVVAHGFPPHAQGGSEIYAYQHRAGAARRAAATTCSC